MNFLFSKRASSSTDEYENIYLTQKEKRILRRIMRRNEVPTDFCSEECRNTLEEHGLIYVNRDTETDIGYGIKKAITPDEPKTIRALDKATRYFLYRKEQYFKGKLPVVIALVALIKSCDREIITLFHFIQDLLTRQ